LILAISICATISREKLISSIKRMVSRLDNYGRLAIGEKITIAKTGILHQRITKLK